jgi:hypothetical protein
MGMIQNRQKTMTIMIGEKSVKGLEPKTSAWPSQPPIPTLSVR